MMNPWLVMAVSISSREDPTGTSLMTAGLTVARHAWNTQAVAPGSREIVYRSPTWGSAPLPMRWSAGMLKSMPN